MPQLHERACFPPPISPHLASETSASSRERARPADFVPTPENLDLLTRNHHTARAPASQSIINVNLPWLSLFASLSSAMTSLPPPMRLSNGSSMTRRRAFTLIELLVVVGIIAILI